VEKEITNFNFVLKPTKKKDLILEKNILLCGICLKERGENVYVFPICP